MTVRGMGHFCACLPCRCSGRPTLSPKPIKPSVLRPGKAEVGTGHWAIFRPSSLLYEAAYCYYYDDYYCWGSLSAVLYASNPYCHIEAFVLRTLPPFAVRTLRMQACSGAAIFF